MKLDHLHPSRYEAKNVGAIPPLHVYLCSEMLNSLSIRRTLTFHINLFTYGLSLLRYFGLPRRSKVPQLWKELSEILFKTYRGRVVPVSVNGLDQIHCEFF
jgi:hypothetical protein